MSKKRQKTSKIFKNGQNLSEKSVKTHQKWSGIVKARQTRSEIRQKLSKESQKLPIISQRESKKRVKKESEKRVKKSRELAKESSQKESN